jgi:hypothetical protein
MPRKSQHEAAETDAPDRSHAKMPIEIYGRNRPAGEFCTELYDALKATATFYQRGGHVFKLVERDQQPALELLTPAMAVTAFEEHVNFTSTNRDGEVVLVSLREDQARVVLNSEARFTLPAIETVAHCPILAENENGELRYFNHGYVPHLRMFITGNQEVPIIRLADSVQMLLDLIQHYKFAAPSDESRAVASFLTPALKQGGFLKSHVPINIIDADKQQSGKTKLAESCASAYGIKIEALSQQIGGVGSTDERIATAMLKGTPFILLDNWRGTLNSACLEAALTSSGSFQVRTPGKPAVGVDATRFFFFLTSNGLATTPDLMERASIVSIVNRPGYKFPDYPEGSLPAHVLAHHLDYLAAIYAVIVEWYNQGMPRNDQEMRHSFREWAQVLDWIVQNIFGLPALLDGHDEARKRTQEPSLAILRQICLAIDQVKSLRKVMQAQAIADIAEECGIDLGTGKRTDDRAAAKQVGTIMSRAFRSLTNSNEEEAEIEDFEGFYIRRKRIQIRRANRNERYNSWVYCIQKEPVYEMPEYEADWEGQLIEDDDLERAPRRGRNPFPQV